MPLLEEKQLQVSDISTSVGDDSEQKQRRQMLIALALLLAALILVLIKDRDFWFPPAPVAPVQSEAEPVEDPPADSENALRNGNCKYTRHSPGAAEAKAAHAAARHC